MSPSSAPIRFFGRLLVAMTVLGLLTVWSVGSLLIAPHRCDVGELPSDLPGRSTTIITPDGIRLATWHVAHPNSKGVVVLLHPLKGSRKSMLSRAQFLYQAGFSIVMPDFRAHGQSSGNYVSFGHYEKSDADAAIAFAEAKHPQSPIAVIGRSLGGTSALLTGNRKPAVMVIESAYPSIEAATRNRVKIFLGPASWLPTQLLLGQLRYRLGIAPSQLRPIDEVHSLNNPTLFICGSQDTRTTATETRNMFTRSNASKQLWIVSGAGHEDLHAFDPLQYEERVLEFIEEHCREN